MNITNNVMMSYNNFNSKIKSNYKISSKILCQKNCKKLNYYLIKIQLNINKKWSISK